MAGKDPNHWLFRFDREEWLKAAQHELAECLRALNAGARKQSVAYARRAAGMALNAVLVDFPDDSWGRSYMDHLQAIARNEQTPEEVRVAAAALLTAPLDAPRLIPIGGKSDDGLAKAAERILSWCERPRPTA